MPRSQVISSLITRYDKIVNGTDKSAIELAVFKIAICQLVDAAFSGGGGGGSISAATVSDGIDGSTDITTILDRLTDLVAKPNPPTQSDIVSAIQSAADIDTIIARLVSLDTGKLTQTNIENAIQSAADIDTIIARLTSIATNTSQSLSSIITTYTPSNLVVTDVGALVLDANSSRKGAIIVNRSTTITANLFFGAIGIFDSGLLLLPQQSYQIDTTNLYQGAIRAITPTGTNTIIAALEGV